MPPPPKRLHVINQDSETISPDILQDHAKVFQCFQEAEHNRLCIS